MPRAALVLVLAIAAAGAGPVAGQPDGATVAERIGRLSRTSRWTSVDAVPLGFRTFHPQGLVKAGESFFLSSVEVRVPTVRFPTPVDGYDRDAGEGVGHLFKMDAHGRLLADLTFPAGAAYHPGGIDYDGRHIWVPVSEYRPDSHSIVYKVDPSGMIATEVFRFPDSIGAIVHDTDSHALFGVNWGSRRFYRWPLDDTGAVTHAGVPPDRLGRPNPSHYIDYQDCKYAGARRMLCAGLAELQQPAAPRFHLGGLDLVSLDDGRPLHQVPIQLWTPGGTVMTRNPFWIEPNGSGLRVYFLPEDDRSTLYVYDVQ